MFNWVVKVVPHPPDTQDDLRDEPITTNGKTSNRDKSHSYKTGREEDQSSQTSQGSVQNGMLNWLSNGFVSALPQPAGSPHLTRANADAKSLQEEGSADRTRVIGWISQGIGKVVPQPDEKYIQGETPESEVTEVQDFFSFSIYFRSTMTRPRAVRELREAGGVIDNELHLRDAAVSYLSRRSVDSGDRDRCDAQVSLSLIINHATGLVAFSHSPWPRPARHKNIFKM
ncbi:uncharacterized protein LOC143721280 [Siphateles boraxobius]|uniref:uncharacterized protein LOC143721280 n=1 Tax=Siphateles boraxobius TaxID=180520 RepID=UPI0040638A0B